MEPFGRLPHPSVHWVDGQLVLVEKRRGAHAVDGHDEQGESGWDLVDCPNRLEGICRYNPEISKVYAKSLWAEIQPGK